MCFIKRLISNEFKNKFRFIIYKRSDYSRRDFVNQFFNFYFF